MAETKQLSIVEYMSNPNIQGNIEKTLRDRTPQFIASVAALVNSNPKLAMCERKSVLSACLISASLDLPINQNLGFAYIIPYDKKTPVSTVDSNGRELTKWEVKTEAQFQMGAKGFKQLAIRTGQYKFINDEDVREGEYKGKNRLTGEYIFEWIEDATKRESLPIVGYVSYFKLITGFEKALYMTAQELKNHGLRYSKSFKTGNWTSDFDSMARKTVIKLLLSRYGLMSSQLERAIEADQAVIDEDRVSYVDNAPIDPQEVAYRKERERIESHIQNSKTIQELGECEEALEAYDQDLRKAFDDKFNELAKK